MSSPSRARVRPALHALIAAGGHDSIGANLSQPTAIELISRADIETEAARGGEEE
eukprot:CAMPEP_0115859320 /NCGR_PEP_ID=MMETSP0287-20121206/16555_1 /TAXON_ID=412157 /ORGANISM="Chrysochromulina rotalis, Strain UIO044" /LENGTH=54 /DNA_ID=CAMNT_0003313617 /DNA_START=128 /DNA_END=292 /DNA_ORIENTATION=-